MSMANGTTKTHTLAGGRRTKLRRAGQGRIHAAEPGIQAAAEPSPLATGLRRSLLGHLRRLPGQQQFLAAQLLAAQTQLLAAQTRPALLEAKADGMTTPRCSGVLGQAPGTEPSLKKDSQTAGQNGWRK